MPLSISPPTTDIEIVSQACILCGREGFNSIESGGAFAESADRLYGTLVSAELGSNRWRFAMGTLQIASLTTLSPEFDGWNFYYELPSDLLMLHHLDPYIKYTVFGSRLLTYTNQSLTAVYTKNVPVSKWPPAFSMYIIYALATMLATNVASSAALAGALREERNAWQSRALFADGQSSPAQQIISRPWIEARYGYYRRGGN